MPSVDDNTKYRCKTPGCGRIYDFPTPLDVTPCGGCDVIDFDQIRITVVCDYCQATDVTWTYPCADFVMESPIPSLPHEVKVGAWAACDSCHALIESGDRQGLIDRHLAQSAQSKELLNYPDGRAVLTALLQKLWSRFDDYRTGPPYRHTEGDPE